MSTVSTNCCSKEIEEKDTHSWRDDSIKPCCLPVETIQINMHHDVNG